MKKLLTSFLFLFAVYLTCAQDNLIHSSTSYVDDYANVIDDGSEAHIDAQIRAFKEKTTVEISVVTVTSLEGKEINQFGLDLGRRWGVGGRSNNGILILIAPTDHKWSVQIGTGLERDFTDYRSKELGDEIFPSNFRAGNYGPGIEQYIDAVIRELDPAQKAIREAEVVKQAQIAKDQWTDFFQILMWVLGIGLIVALVVIMVRASRRELRAKQERKEELARAAREVDLFIKSIDGKARYIEDQESSMSKLFDQYLTKYAGLITHKVSYTLNGSAATCLLQLKKIKSTLQTYYANGRIDDCKSFMRTANECIDEFNAQFRLHKLIMDQVDQKLALIASWSKDKWKSKDNVSLGKTYISQAASLQYIQGIDKVKEKAKKLWAGGLSFVEMYLLAVALEELLAKAMSGVQHDEYVEQMRLQGIRDENNRKRRKQEEEEDDNRRRSSSYISSPSPSYNNESSSSSTSSFGGGSFDGGGSSGSW